ncbi:MAG: HD domain-containing protein [Candidatus Methanomethylicia archaeon]|jgi:7,8-dihydroneopterin 2',3'-cyclic phosphate phosphodiesterase|nr:HD domain-containing protein [Candidatus Methanomethylicia archaeon]
MKDDPLIELAEKINNPDLRQKVIELLKNPKLTFLDHPEKYTSLKDSPASKRRHHSYQKGLVIHTIATTRLALSLAEILEEIYKVRVDRDVVIAASLLHDLFKHLTYFEVYPGKYVRSKLGERLDHLSLIIGELYARKFPLDVIHAVVAHHGDNGPIEPRTVEALLVHMADRTDAEINDKVLFAAKEIIKECLMKEVVTLPREVSPYEVIIAKKEGGCEEVRRRFSSMI